ncbi:ATP synthase mitochondrial F1 complex assembly factor 2-like [Ptychodera flava]|uniref:ATP synthase mitochondrial F1 complex assembly factor 2-like n=1 Tax=Ptychodera flava TaxID=63121 RepID=UPI00396AB0FF
MFTRFSILCLRCNQQRAWPTLNQGRKMSSFLKDLKKFYKSVSITQSGGLYEINLDKRKLKTPMGKIFTVPSEPLAIAVATEWEAQEKTIKKHTMPLTSLCNSALDNPTERSKETIIQSILHFLSTDTVCFREEQPPELYALQQNEWDPILEWVNKRYEVNIQATTSLLGPEITPEIKHVFEQHLRVYNSWAIVGYESAVQSLKSLILTAALIDRHLTVEEAVSLSRLEYAFQTAQWGRVEWAHDLDEAEMKARVAAATLFVHFCSENSKMVEKLDAQQEQSQ